VSSKSSRRSTELSDLAEPRNNLVPTGRPSKHFLGFVHHERRANADCLGVGASRRRSITARLGWRVNLSGGRRLPSRALGLARRSRVRLPMLRGRGIVERLSCNEPRFLDALSPGGAWRTSARTVAARTVCFWGTGHTGLESLSGGRQTRPGARVGQNRRFPRETLWEGRAEREAWERANPRTR